MTGKVVAFDTSRGCGEVEADSGALYPFHCTRIADGTRQVAVGAVVGFRVEPGLPGRWEAFDIRKGP